MPTIFSHAIVAAAAGQWVAPRSNRAPRVSNLGRFWFWTLMCPMLPDVDVIGLFFGIRYDDMLGHRGLTHSVCFAVLAGLVAALAVSRRVSAANASVVGNGEMGVASLWMWFTALTLSHGLLDALTNGGRGVAFFAPITGDRYFFPWRPIQVSPIGVGFFSPRGLRVLASESAWIWVPSAIIAVSARLSRKGGRATALHRGQATGTLPSARRNEQA